MNFKGWRAVQVGYGRDMNGKPTFDMNQFTISAPKNVKSGTLYLDAIIPVVLLDDRDMDPDAQQPFVNKSNPNKGYAFDSPYFAKKLNFGKLEPLTAQDIEGFRLIEKHLLGEISRNVTPFTTLEKEYNKLNLKRANDGTLTGKHVSYLVQTEVFIKAQRVKDYDSDIVMLRDYGTLMKKIASTYLVEKNPEIKAKLEEMFVNMSEHVFDQGFVYDSVRGTSHHFGYVSREYFASLLLMREVLEKHHLLELAGDSGIWYNGLRWILDQKNLPKPDADIFNTLTMSSLIALALLPDTPEKAEYLRLFQYYYSKNIGTSTPGDMGGFKKDGCVFHHWGHYPGYGFPAMNGAALAIYILRGTPWELSKEANESLTRALKAAYIFTNYQLSNPESRVTAMGIAGRHPFAESSLQGCLPAYKYMSFDPEMAAIHRRLAPKSKLFSDIEVAKTPEGHWSFNYGCFGIHRYKEKMVSLKGYSRAVWSSEIYTNDNRFGRYQSNGAIEILPQGNHQEAGWDWNRNPGTTTLYRPLDVLESPIRHTLMLCSESRNSGSSNLENRYGAFGVELMEPKMDRFDPEFKAVKSVFSFGPRLVALGSGITAASEYPVETTLLQYPTAKDKYPVYFNSSKPVKEMEVSQELKAPAWVADDFGNAWFVFSDSNLKMSRKLQKSRQNKTKAETQGEFAAIWIDHGVKPKSDKYEYLLNLDMTPEEAEKAMESMRDVANRPYTILRQDNDCHAVYDKESKVTAAIFFKAAPKADMGILVGVNNPCYVMFRQDDDLKLSVNSTDIVNMPQPHGSEVDSGLHLSVNRVETAGFTRHQQTESEKAKEKEPREVTIRLKGVWKLVTPNNEVKIKIVDNETRITAYFEHGIPVQLHLIK